MALRSSSMVACAAGCGILLASATGLTVTRHRDMDAADRDPASAQARAPAAHDAARLDDAAHPAADPLHGALWAASQRLVMPVAGADPSDLIDTFTQVRGPYRRHEAIDIRAAAGTPVVAVTDGVIMRLTHHDSGGITLYHLAPDGRTIFYYAHLARYAERVREGVPVRQGEVIGYVGDTGNAGPGNYHLHFEITTVPNPQSYWAGRPRNPYPLLLRARG